MAIDKGDYVKFVRSGAVYDSYDEMAEKLGAIDWRRRGWDNYTNKVGVVVAHSKHELYHEKNICLVTFEDGGQLLIGEEGLQVMELGAPKQVTNNNIFHRRRMTKFIEATKKG